MSFATRKILVSHVFCASEDIMEHYVRQGLTAIMHLANMFCPASRICKSMMGPEYANGFPSAFTIAEQVNPVLFLKVNESSSCLTYRCTSQQHEGVTSADRLLQCYGGP